MQSKAPKIGDSGENCRVFFDNARMKKTNGPMINPNDPQEIQDTFHYKRVRSEAPREDPKGQQIIVSQSGAWENGVNVGLIASLGNKQKAEDGETTASQNVLQMNKDIHPRKDPPAQALPVPSKPEPQQEAWPNVPQLDFREDGGEVDYPQLFDSVRSIKKNGGFDALQLKNNLSEPPAKQGCSKVPQFGDGEEEENVADSAYSENARKYKNAENVPVPDLIELPVNLDINNGVWSPSTVGTTDKVDNHQLRDASREAIFNATSETHLTLQNSGDRSPILRKHEQLQQRSPADVYTEPKGKRRCMQRSCRSREKKGELVNRARIPLVDKGLLAKRAQTLARDGDLHVYGGGRSLSSELTGGNKNYVNQFGITSRAFPVSTAVSNTALRKETKLLQPNQEAEKSQVSITDAGSPLNINNNNNNDTLESSHHLPTNHTYKEEKKGSCFPWFV